MFRTQLINAAKEPPDFAGHYRFALWGCGSIAAPGRWPIFKPVRFSLLRSGLMPKDGADG